MNTFTKLFIIFINGIYLVLYLYIHYYLYCIFNIYSLQYIYFLLVFNFFIHYILMHYAMYKVVDQIV